MKIYFSSTCHLRDLEKVKHYGMYLVGRKVCDGYLITCQSPNYPNDHKHDYAKENDRSDCQVIFTNVKGYADPDRNMSNRILQGNYILSVDADEKLSDELVGNWDLIRWYIDKGIHIFWFKFKNIIDGVNIEDILGDDYHPRLWKAGMVVWPPEAHKYPELRSENKIFINWPIIHTRTYDDVIRTHNERVKVIGDEPRQMEERFIDALKKKLGK